MDHYITPARLTSWQSCTTGSGRAHLSLFLEGEGAHAVAVSLTGDQAPRTFAPSADDPNTHTVYGGRSVGPDLSVYVIELVVPQPVAVVADGAAPFGPELGPGAP